MLFQGISPEDLQDFILWSKSVTSTYGLGEGVFQQGQKSPYTYILLKGKVEVDHLSLSGNRTIIATFTKEKSIFGEVYSLLSLPFDYSCHAKEESLILKIPSASLLKTLDQEKFHPIGQNLIQVLASKAYTLNQRLMVQTAPSLREKILRDLDQRQVQGRVDLPFTREKWAEILSIPRPSLSRELSKMAEEGLISIHKRTIFLLF